MAEADTPRPVDPLRSEAFSLIERNIVRQVEEERKRDFSVLAILGQNTFGGLSGRIGLEVGVGYSLSASRIKSYVNQAYEQAVSHYNFVSRREENKQPGISYFPLANNSTVFEVAAEVVRLLALSLIHTDNGADGSGLKAQAFETIERDIVTAVEKARSETTGEVGRLHNEIVNGLKVPTSRMTTLLNQAVADAISHQKSLHKADDDEITPPPIGYEIKKLLVESYLLSLAGNVELSMAAKEAAFNLIERDSTANDFETRRNIRFALAQTDPDSFGYHWGRVGLSFEEALSFSDNAIKRAVTSAEEALMNMGKWVGTVAEYTMTISASGEYTLPREIETVLFVAFDGDPAPVHDRYMEYMRGGTGIKTTDNAWRTGFSDLGHIPDASDGNKIKRKYFITVPQEGRQTVIHYLAKRRFIPHAADTEPMFLRNFEAVSQAALSILTQGQVGSLDAAKKLLADQITQQFMKTQTWGVHNRPIASLR